MVASHQVEVEVAVTPSIGWWLTLRDRVSLPRRSTLPLSDTCSALTPTNAAVPRDRDMCFVCGSHQRPTVPYRTVPAAGILLSEGRTQAPDATRDGSLLTATRTDTAPTQR